MNNTTTPTRSERVTCSLAERIRDHVAAHLAWADEVITKTKQGTAAQSREFLDAQRTRLSQQAFALLKQAREAIEAHETVVADLEQLVRVRESELTLERIERERLERRVAALLLEQSRDEGAKLSPDELDVVRDEIESDVRARCH